MQIPYLRFDKDLPGAFRAHGTDAGTDLFTLEDISLAPGETARVPLNMAVGLPEGVYGMLTGRSSTAARGLLVHVGTVDPGYRGALYVAVTNLAGETLVIRRGERIVQMVIIPFVTPQFVEASSLDATDRGELGWGSSGR